MTEPHCTIHNKPMAYYGDVHGRPKYRCVECVKEARAKVEFAKDAFARRYRTNDRYNLWTALAK